MNTVLLGGNGYIGRAVTEYWLEKDKDMEFYVLSRSGKNELQNSRIHNIAVDTTDTDAVLAAIPETVDYVVDFVGGLGGDDPEKFNLGPADAMLAVAAEKSVEAIGYVGGILGPGSFVKMKKRVIDYLTEKSPVRFEYVEPTLVYGNGRSEAMAKMVPLMKFFGLFSKTFKPVLVTDVAKELVEKLVK